MSIFQIGDEGLKQFAELGAAFLMSALVGLERELRHKSAGLRTYTVVGVTAALIMLVSKYGFTDVLETGRVVLDPSRVAAQTVTGIGFIGAGLVFVRGDVVRGLTTAATVWLVTAIGMACGAGLVVLALAVTMFYFVTSFFFPPLLRLLPGNPGPFEQAEMRTMMEDEVRSSEASTKRENELRRQATADVERVLSTGGVKSDERR